MDERTATHDPKVLGLIPREHRLPALLFATFETVLIGIATGAETSVKIVAIVGMVGIAATFLVRFFPRREETEARRTTKVGSTDEMFANSLYVARSVLARSNMADAGLWQFTEALLGAFRSQSLRFRDFQLIIESGLNKEELTRKGLPFDLILNGYLKMRMDDPFMIRTAYDVTLIFAVVSDSISRRSISEFVLKAKLLLSHGIDIPFGGHFDPWDTWLFIMGRKIDQDVRDVKIEELHQPYVNVLLFTFDGDAIRKCPHKWMDQVLEAFKLAWKAKL